MIESEVRGLAAGLARQPEEREVREGPLQVSFLPRHDLLKPEDRGMHQTDLTSELVAPFRPFVDAVLFEVEADIVGHHTEGGAAGLGCWAAHSSKHCESDREAGHAVFFTSLGLTARFGT